MVELSDQNKGANTGFHMQSAHLKCLTCIRPFLLKAQLGITQLRDPSCF